MKAQKKVIRKKPGFPRAYERFAKVTFDAQRGRNLPGTGLKASRLRDSYWASTIRKPREPRNLVSYVTPKGSTKYTLVDKKEIGSFKRTHNKSFKNHGEGYYARKDKKTDEIIFTRDTRGINLFAQKPGKPKKTK